MEVSICLALPPSVLQHSFLPRCVLPNGRGNTSLLHIRSTSTKRHYSLGAWAIRNTGLALLLNHFQSAHSKKKKNVLDNLFSPLFPRYGVDLILIFALSIFQPIYPCIHLLLLSLKCGLESVEHQTLYRGTENTKMSGPSLCHPL